MEKIQVTIKGISPLLMHAFPLEPIEAIEKLSKEKQAEQSAYRDPETKRLYVPAIALQRAFVNGAAYSRGKGRASLAKIAAACILILPERIDLGMKDYEIDIRPVVVPATKGRILRCRPRIDKWKLTFEIEYDPTLLTVGQVRRIVDDTGSRVGILDFRPERRGPFGKFMITQWE